jgi:hypothetical protein
MAQVNVYSDANYSSLTFVNDDTLLIDFGATLTINTGTARIGGVTFGSTGGGKLKVVNTSTTTPIFIPHSGSLSIGQDGEFQVDGALIELGTGNGSTRTYTLPTDLGGNYYADLGAVWVDEGKLFRDSTPFKTTFTQVSSLTNKLSSHTFGNVFRHDTVNNNITFLKPVPNGYKIYIPNVQFKATHVANSTIVCSGPVNINYASLSRLVAFGGNSSYNDINLNYCGFGNVFLTGTANSRRMSSRLTMLNVGFYMGYNFDVYASALGTLCKNVMFVTTETSRAFSCNTHPPDMYLEKITGLYEKEQLTRSNSNHGSFPIQANSNGGKIYDLHVASLAGRFEFGNDMTIENAVFLNCGNLNQSYVSTISNVTAGTGGRILITTSSSHGMHGGSTGFVRITGVNGVPANGIWRITTIAHNGTTFELDSSTFSGTYTGGGTVESFIDNNTHVVMGGSIGYDNLIIGLSCIPSPDSLLSFPGGLHRRQQMISMDTGCGRNTWSNCVFSLSAVCNSPGSTFIFDRSVGTRFNKVLISGSAPAPFRPSSIHNIQTDCSGLVLTDYTLENNPTVVTNGTNFAGPKSRYERMFLEESNPSANFGYAWKSLIDLPSALNYIDTTKTKGRVAVFNSPTGSIQSFVPSPQNRGQVILRSDGKVFIQYTGDMVTTETLTYGGLTGISGFYARDEVVGSISNIAIDAAATTDCPYQYALSMRRPNGTYTTPQLVYGSRLTGSNQTANYNVGDSVAQTIASGLTAFGTVDLINSTELRICNITTLSSTPNPNYLWGHFLDNNTTYQGTTQGIRNLTTNYVPPSNPFTNQYEYNSSKTVTALNNTLNSLPADPKNQVQFQVHVIRDYRDTVTDTQNQRYYGSVIDVNLDPNYVVEFNVLEATISCPNLITGTRLQLYNVTKSLELDNTTLSNQGYSKTYDLLGNTFNIGDTIRLRATKHLGLSAYEPLEVLGAVTESGVAFPQALALDDIYLSNSIDGSTIAGISLTPDYTNIQIDLTDNTPPYQITAQQIYNYYIYLLSTEQGIRNFYGAISPIDRMNYQINSAVVPLKIQNTGTTDVIINGGRLYRDDNISIVDTGTGAGTGSLVHDTGFLLQFIQPQVDAAVGGLATNSDMQTVKADVANIKKKANLIPSLV